LVVTIIDAWRQRHVTNDCVRVAADSWVQWTSRSTPES